MSRRRVKLTEATEALRALRRLAHEDGAGLTRDQARTLVDHFDDTWGGWSAAADLAELEALRTFYVLYDSGVDGHYLERAGLMVDAMTGLGPLVWHPEDSERD